MNLITKLTNGFLGLTFSRKGSLSLIILAGSLTALFFNKLESNAFAAVVATIGVIYNFVQSRVDMTFMNYNSNANVNIQQDIQHKQPSDEDLEKVFIESVSKEESE